MNGERRPASDPAPWKVLLVDDEPSVHEVSRLILAGLSFEGRDVELLSAGSAAQARDVLAGDADIALILLDVVMETDDAGIVLVQHIREVLGNTDTQIVLRTGQPGMAPERDVVLRYEINGYFLKTDITAQRLQSIVISALRNYRNALALRTPPGRVVQRAAPPRPSGAPSALGRELEQLREDESVLLQAQPEVLLASNQVMGIELVPQWKTVAGLVSARRFGEAVPAGPARRRAALWLLQQASFWARSWHSVAGATLTVSVPLVGESLDDGETLEAIVDAVRAAELAPRALDLLVGEATLLNSAADTRTAIATLRALGATFTLTDFGAETIALQRLNQGIPDRLKIHRLFVRHVAADAERTAMARSLLALAQTMNVVTIAEGIASDSDAQFFKWEGCDLGQGDALAPACAPADVSGFLLTGRKPQH